jgi:hypothetical protein
MAAHQVCAGWSSTTFTVSGSSEHGMAVAAGFDFNSVAGSDIQTIPSVTTPVPGPTDAETLGTHTEAPFPNRRTASSTTRLAGDPNLGGTLSGESSAGTQVINDSVNGVFRAEASSTATFAGQAVYSPDHGQTVSVAARGDYSVFAFAQNAATFEQQRAEALVRATLDVSNLTNPGSGGGSHVIFTDSRVQTFCGSPCLPSSVYSSFDETASVSLAGMNPGDVFLVEVAFYAQGLSWAQHLGDVQDAGAVGSAGFSDFSLEFTSIPEPGTALLLVLGLVGSSLLRRRTFSGSRLLARPRG